MEPRGPLDGVTVIELAGLGPCPMCGMLLAELGAAVLRIERVTPSGLGFDLAPGDDLLNRSRPGASPPAAGARRRARAGWPGARRALEDPPGVTEACLDRAVRGAQPALVRRASPAGRRPFAGSPDTTELHRLSRLARLGRAERAARAEPRGDFGGGGLYWPCGLARSSRRGSPGWQVVAPHGRGRVRDDAASPGARSRERRRVRHLRRRRPLYDVYGRATAASRVAPIERVSTRAPPAPGSRRLRVPSAGGRPATSGASPPHSYPHRDAWMTVFRERACVARPTLDEARAPPNRAARTRSCAARAAAERAPASSHAEPDLATAPAVRPRATLRDWHRRLAGRPPHDIDRADRRRVSGAGDEGSCAGRPAARGPSETEERLTDHEGPGSGDRGRRVVVSRSRCRPETLLPGWYSQAEATLRHAVHASVLHERAREHERLCIGYDGCRRDWWRSVPSLGRSS